MMRRKRLRSSFWRAVSDLGAKQEFGMPKDPFIANAAMTTYLQSLPVIDGAPLIKEWDKLFRHVHSRQQARNRIAHFQTLIMSQEPPGRRQTLWPRLFDPNNLIRYRNKRMPVYRVHDLELIRRSFIEGENPKGETECAIVIQMACVHSATMAVLGRLGGGHGGDRHVLAAATAASRLSRTFAILVETLRRLRNGGSQVIRIERVDVREGGQAVIGNIDQGRARK
jgi:hypothetical protein